MSENASFAQVGLPKFDGDYEHWSLLMENLLRSKEYWEVVTNGIPETAAGVELSATETKNLEDLRLKDLKAKNYLFSSIDKSIFKTITKKSTGKQLWDAMKIKYQGSARVQKAQLQALKRTFEVLEMKEGEALAAYFSRVIVVANDMRNCGGDMPDVKVVEKILRTLTKRFNYVVCSIEESKDIETLSVDAIQSSLLVLKRSMLFRISCDSGARGGRSGRGGGYQGRGRGRGGRGWSKDNVECFKCHKYGHYQYECPGWYPNPHQSHFTQNDMTDDVLLMAFLEDSNKTDMET
ncbi:unnamed protein product [Linum trigynum]|uniref:CCHC-type domain-containing protein n=1 Tax=Linum trigynum TaxID=586398 RepID=A0AAV2FP44_9ROSI